jgi:hypothetical protein
LINSTFAFTDNLVTPVTHLAQIDRIKEFNNTSANNNLVWIGSDPASGKGQHTAVDVYGSGQKPIYIGRHGGWIYIPNTFDRHYETVTMTPAIAAPCTDIRFRIILGGTLNEYYDNSTGQQGMARDRSNTRIAFGKTPTEVDPAAGGVPAMYRLHMYVGYRDAGGNYYMEIDGVPYNGGATMAIGTNNITEEAAGATGHPCDTLRGPSFLISGAQTPGNAAWIAMVNAYKNWFQSYSGLTLNGYPTAFPYVTLDNGGFNDNPVWNNGLNRWEIPTSAQLKNGADTYICTWWNGGPTNGVQYENRSWIKTIESTDRTALFLNRTELGGDSETITNNWICFELWAKNSSTGEVTPFDIKSKFKQDNIT